MSSPLELYHPAGTAPRMRVVGSEWLSLLGPPRPANDEGQADLVVVAPTDAECRAPGWFTRAANSTAAALADEAVAFLIAPRRWRSQLLSAARAAGLELGPAVLHLPNYAWSRHLVAADRSALRYATECLLPRTSWKSRAASLVCRFPGGERLVAYQGAASVIARRRGGTALLAWLSEAAGTPVRADRVVVTPSWRAQQATFTIAVVDEGTIAPWLVARVGSGPKAAREDLGEERALAAFSDSAQAAGAAVPRVKTSTQLDGAPVVVESGVAGRVAATLLAERPDEADAVLDRTLVWLLRWNRLTAAESQLTRAYVEQEVLSPARAVTPSLEVGADYLARLERLCDELVGRRSTLVAAHDDLTMVNVLVGRDGGLGVVDWDTARPDALPLVDFFYAVVDVSTASTSYADRPRAFEACFVKGVQPPAVREHQQRFEQALAVDPPVAELAFHACWLHHAANELARGETNGSFLAIVRLLAADPERFRP